MSHPSATKSVNTALPNARAPLTQGAHHIGLTVPDMAQTRAFFVDTLEFSQVGEVPDYPAVFLTDGTTMLTLWQAADPATATPFDRKNVIGLHHFALRVDAASLDALAEKLETTDGVMLDFAPEPLGGGPARHLMCAITSEDIEKAITPLHARIAELEAPLKRGLASEIDEI